MQGMRAPNMAATRVLSPHVGALLTGKCNHE